MKLEGKMKLEVTNIDEDIKKMLNQISENIMT